MRTTIYRYIGYILGGVLLWFAMLNTGVRILWGDSGCLQLVYSFPAWWMVLATGEALLACLLFLPAIHKASRQSRTVTFTRGILAIVLSISCIYWYRREGGLFHDFVAHGILGECSGAYACEQWLSLIATSIYTLAPGWSFLVSRAMTRKED